MLSDRGADGRSSIVAFDHLYATQGGNCLGDSLNGTGPQVKWAYNTGAGNVLTSPVLSLDGSKMAFVENSAGGATLRILKWKDDKEPPATGYSTRPFP